MHTYIFYVIALWFIVFSLLLYEAKPEVPHVQHPSVSMRSTLAMANVSLSCLTLYYVLFYSVHLAHPQSWPLFARVPGGISCILRTIYQCKGVDDGEACRYGYTEPEVLDSRVWVVDSRWFHGLGVDVKPMHSNMLVFHLESLCLVLSPNPYVEFKDQLCYVPRNEQQ